MAWLASGHRRRRAGLALARARPGRCDAARVQGRQGARSTASSGPCCFGLIRALDLVLAAAAGCPSPARRQRLGRRALRHSGDGYFAFVLAAVVLVAGFAPLFRGGDPLFLLAGLGWSASCRGQGRRRRAPHLACPLVRRPTLVVLAPAGPEAHRVVLLAGLGVAAAVAVATGGRPGRAGRPRRPVRRAASAALAEHAAGVVVDSSSPRSPAPPGQQPFARLGPAPSRCCWPGLIALRPPPPFDAGLVDGPGASSASARFGSLLLILLSDTGVTCARGGGLFLLAIPAWAGWTSGGQHGRPSPGPGRPAEAASRRASPWAGPSSPGTTPARATARSWMAPTATRVAPTPADPAAGQGQGAADRERPA